MNERMLSRTRRRALGLLLGGAMLALLAAGPVAAQSPIKIGLAGVMSGPVALIGQQSKEGADLRVREINEAGGILGRKLELYVADHACDPAQGITAVTKLISSDNVSAIIGSSCSSVTLAVMPLIQRSQVPQLEYLGTNPKITGGAGVGGNIWQFRLNIDDGIMVQALSKYIANKKVKSVAIIAQNDEYGRGAAAQFKGYLEPDGVKVVSMDFAASGTPDYRPIITKIKGLTPEGLIAVMDAPNAAPLALQTAEMDFHPKVFGRGTVVTPAFQNLVKNPDIWDGAVEVNRWVDNPGAHDFAEAFKKAYGRPPELNNAMAYYAVEVLADAIKRAGSDERSKVRDALEKTDLKLPGLGPVKFDDHHQAHPDMFLIQWQHGKIALLDRRPTGR
jgi:branched-chain amino acid transport system substrate-binding protein